MDPSVRTYGVSVLSGPVRVQVKGTNRNELRDRLAQYADRADSNRRSFQVCRAMGELAQNIYLGVRLQGARRWRGMGRGTCANSSAENAAPPKKKGRQSFLAYFLLKLSDPAHFHSAGNYR